MTTERQQESLVASTLDYLDKLWKNAPKDVVKITTGVQIGDNVKRVSVHVPDNLKTVQLIHITDVQFGHILCNVKKLVEYRDWILRAPNRFVLFGGDMVDAATILSKGSPYENTDEPKTQMMRFCEIVMPMRHRVLGYVGGNHEAHSVKTYGTLGSTIATFLKIPYSDGKQLIDVHFGAHRPFPISMFHGTGAARTKGSKAQMLHRFMQSADSLLYLVGHLHDAITLWHWRERRTADNKIFLQKTCGMMSSSFLEYYGCVDQKTEILTSEGWKNHETMRGDEVLPTLNLQSGKMEWQQAKEKIAYDYFGEMAHYDILTINMAVTPNHRVVVENTYLGKLQVRRADELPKYSSNLYFPQAKGPFDELPSTLSISPATASVLGWFLAEGYYRKDGAAGISQSDKVNHRKVQAIRLALKKMGLQFSEHWSKDRSIVNFYLPKKSADVMRHYVPDKLLTWELAFLPQRQARKLFNALMRGDGTFGRTRNDWSWKQKSESNRHIFQALCLRLGYNATMVSDEVVSVRKFDRAAFQQPMLWEPHYSGKVWCVQTPNTTFVARRGGKAFITGNSYAERMGLDPTELVVSTVMLFEDGHWEVRQR